MDYNVAKKIFKDTIVYPGYVIMSGYDTIIRVRCTVSPVMETLVALCELICTSATHIFVSSFTPAMPRLCPGYAPAMPPLYIFSYTPLLFTLAIYPSIKHPCCIPLLYDAIRRAQAAVKAKVAQKAGKSKYQWNILAEMVLIRGCTYPGY